MRSAHSQTLGLAMASIIVAIVGCSGSDQGSIEAMVSGAGGATGPSSGGATVGKGGTSAVSGGGQGLGTGGNRSATGGSGPIAMGGSGNGGSPSTGGAIGTGGNSVVGGGTATGGKAMGGAATTGGAATGGKAAGGAATGGAATTGGKATGGAATGGAATGGKATGGAATGGSTGSCAMPWSPPSNLTSALSTVWQHEMSTYGNPTGFRNFAWDQVIANNGSINYCVRWDSSAAVTAAQRDQVHAALARQWKKWMDAMVESGRGWDCWPYTEVPLKVVGWAVRDRNTLQWTDTSVDVYVNDIREDAPQCAEACGRFFHQDGNYSSCTAGAARHYDMSLWLTAGMAGGAGGDWGQRVGSEYFMGAVSSDSIHIVLHEMGHSLALDDFYDWDPGVGGFVMMAGSATVVTDFDKWMLRDWWRQLIKGRYGY